MSKSGRSQVLNKFEKIFTGRSVVRLARLLWEQEVAGSNPAAPTKEVKSSKRILRLEMQEVAGFQQLPDRPHDHSS